MMTALSRGRPGTQVITVQIFGNCGDGAPLRTGTGMGRGSLGASSGSQRRSASCWLEPVFIR